MFMRVLLSDQNRSIAPASGASWWMLTAPVCTLTTAAASVALPSFWNANHMITAPPTINALPWIRSAQAQALRPPAVT
jgi:hypothetical protein